jgi:hypothetical protein
METDKRRRLWRIAGALAAFIGLIFLISAIAHFIDDFRHPLMRTHSGPGGRILLLALPLLFGGIGVFSGHRLSARLLFAANALVILVVVNVFQGNILALFERTNGPIVIFVVSILALELMLLQLIGPAPKPNEL